MSAVFSAGFWLQNAPIDDALTLRCSDSRICKCDANALQNIMFMLSFVFVAALHSNMLSHLFDLESVGWAILSDKMCAVCMLRKSSAYMFIFWFWCLLGFHWLGNFPFCMFCFLWARQIIYYHRHQKKLVMSSAKNSQTLTVSLDKAT